MGKLTILAVDDHVDTLRALEILAEAEGHTVLTASTCAEALERAKSIRLDLAILDHALPDGDGVQLLKDINAIQPVVGIAVTAQAYPQDVQKSMSAGFYQHLSKPVDFNALMRAIAKCVESRQRIDDARITPAAARSGQISA